MSPPVPLDPAPVRREEEEEGEEEEVSRGVGVRVP
jgi:hypothetical protein